MPFDQQKVDITNASDNKKLKKKSKDNKKRSVWKSVFWFLFILAFAVGAAVAVIAIGYIKDSPELDPARLATVETSYLYDAHGNELLALHEEQNRVAVDLDEIPVHVRSAFVAIEDERFFTHFGFDIIGSIRAAFANLQAGGIVQGASTLTQQLAQSAFLSTETSYKRKVQEIWLAIQMERIYSKEEIMELYLNRVYFGNGAYGVEAAAQTYFNKSVGELTIPEGAMLAAALRYPNYYNPIDNQQAAEERMQLVLSNMYRLEMITAEEFEEAINQKLTYAAPKGEDYPFPHFVDYVVHHELLNLLSEMPSIGSREEAYKAIYTGGLRIYTTLDPKVQKHVEETMQRADLYPTTIHVDMDAARLAVKDLPARRDLTSAQIEELLDEANGVPQPQAAVVVADPTSGQIRALGGGREYRKRFDEILRFNVLRQPGSAIKPITTYGPAFEEGVLAGAGSTIDDAPFIGPAGNWFPENFDFRFRGMITARESLYMSFNIPAIRTLEALGPRIGATYAERMGLSTLDQQEFDNLSLTLGALTYGVSAIDMAQAYSVLANAGVKIELHTIEKVLSRSGEVIYENEVTPEQVLSPQAAFLVNDILQDYVTKYLGRALQIDRPVAAKSGTTENWKDVYLVAYTPNLVASFWMGYDEPKMGRIQQGWRYSTAFLREVFLDVFEDLEIQNFEKPEGIVSATVCSRSGLIPTDACRAAGTITSDYFIAGNAPGETCNMHIGNFYNRPAFITTDHRWSSRGGAGRVPEDSKEMPPGGLLDMFEQQGETTAEFNLFNAVVTPGGITLQWQYNGPEIAGFVLSRSIQGRDDGGFTTELDAGTRQYNDTDTEHAGQYAYSIAAVSPEGLISEAATIVVSNTAMPGSGGLLRPEDTALVTIPDCVGTFQAIAEGELARLGLKIGLIEEQFDPDKPRKTVLSQYPSAGLTVPKGTMVNLVVSTRHNPAGEENTEQETKPNVDQSD